MRRFLPTAVAASMFYTVSAIAAIGGSPTAGAAQVTASASVPTAPRSLLVAAIDNFETQPRISLQETLYRSGGRLSLSIRSDAITHGSEGFISSNTKALGFHGTFRFILTGNSVFVKAGPPYWKATLPSATTQSESSNLAKIVRAVANRWIEVNGTIATSVITELQDVTDPVGIGSRLISADTTGSVTLGRKSFVRGVAVTTFLVNGNNIFDISVAHPSLPVLMVARNTIGHGTMRFEYPSKLIIAAPKNYRTLADVTRVVAR